MTEPTQTEPQAPNPGRREAVLHRLELGRYEAVNPRGGSIRLGDGSDEDFTPVELFLVAIAGCSAVDVDHLTTRRAEPTSFTVTTVGDKIKDEVGARMEGLEVTFSLTFPEGAEGDRARAMVERAITTSHSRLCSVSRTVEHGTKVTMREG